MTTAVLFIDGGYLAKISKSFGMPKIDFLALSETLCRGDGGGGGGGGGDDGRLRTYYYYCMPFQGSPPSAEESSRYGRADKFVKSLSKLPKFEVRLGRFQRIQNGSSAAAAAAAAVYVQKGIDVMLAVDLVKMSWSKQIDRAIILASDSDFIYAVQTAKDAGVSTQLCYSDRHPVSDLMLDVFDERLIITDDLLKHCLLATSK
jgi:uncharacterized LabA/DUF88 family protein